MKKKLTGMSTQELRAYSDKWEKRMSELEVGSKKWRKAYRRVRRANKVRMK